MNSRRSFISRLGVGASAAVASVVGIAKAETTRPEGADQRVALLEEEMVLRKFHQTFERAMDKGLHEEVIGMFAADAEVLFNGGVFSKRQGVTRLFRDKFVAGKTGGSMEQAPGFELAPEQQRDSVEIAADLLTANAAFTYSIQVGMPVETENSLAAMARLHGEGVRTWWEGGVYRIGYRKDAAGVWKIGRLEYDTLARADWRSGKRYAQPISVARLSARYPADQLGPDVLV